MAMIDRLVDIVDRDPPEHCMLAGLFAYSAFRSNRPGR
jgi:hypothetical protein